MNWIKIIPVSVVMIMISLLKVNGQIIKVNLCEEFLEAKELYVFDNKANTSTFTTSGGEQKTFLKLVEENWSDKKIILVDSDVYDKKKIVKSLFHISISTFEVSKNGAQVSGIDGIILQKGKSGRDPKKTLYWMNINYKEISEGVLSERLNYAVKNMKMMLDNYEDKSFRNGYVYKKEGFEDLLKTNTLYFRKSNLKQELQSESALKRHYSNKCQIVSNEEWAEAVKIKKEGVLFIELIRGGRYTAIDIYTAKDGELIIASYGWISPMGNYIIDQRFFKKLFQK